jgi:hypothetical protein
LNSFPAGAPTSPGTEINVTPDKAVPIIPKATKYHFELRLAIKKVELSADFRDVKYEIPIRSRKYPIKKDRSTIGDIY